MLLTDLKQDALDRPRNLEPSWWSGQRHFGGPSFSFLLNTSHILELLILPLSSRINPRTALEVPRAFVPPPVED